MYSGKYNFNILFLKYFINNNQYGFTNNMGTKDALTLLSTP